MLDQERAADRAQDRRPAPGRAPPPGEAGGEWLERIEHRRHLPLVAGQGDALGQGVGDDQQMLGRRGPQLQGAGRGDLLVFVRTDQDLRDLVLDDPLGRRDARLQPLQGLRLLRLVQAEQHRHAIAEQHHHPALADLERQRGGGDRAVGLRARAADPLAQHHRVDAKHALGGADRPGDLLVQALVPAINLQTANGPPCPKLQTGPWRSRTARRKTIHRRQRRPLYPKLQPEP